MTRPLVIDLPHSLGTQEARRRMEGGVGKLSSHIPGGAADVRHHWEGDSMHLAVTAMGQTVTTRIDVEDKKVHVELVLPGMLGMFAGQIEAYLRGKGGQLLEDKTPGKA
ncbi:polyhydroxyalkanoic acid system family protein [Allosphingosinicella vermicomposti]|uniref:polyhydroxyalkanoic acid system family protein n=1 Tax=Allosphingosinicella vermicomposti TaxID=614671 RepID=UPI000D0F3CF4|nr:polyhydroxyalkanoic acid system family protein [Allosphingosinicella vermicomposti]